MFRDRTALAGMRAAWHTLLSNIRRWWRKPSPPPSLAGRILGMLLLGMLVIYLIANIGLWWASTRLLDNNLRKQAVQWVAELDELGTLHYVFRGQPHLAVIDQRLKNFPEILFVRYYDSQGRRVIAQYGSPPPEAALSLSEEQMHAAQKPSESDAPYPMTRETAGSGPPYLRIIAPLRVKSTARDGAAGFRLDDAGRERVRVVGYIELGLNAAYYSRELNKSMAFGSGLVALLLLLTLLAGRWLVRHWLAPLVALRVPLERLANGDTSVRVESSGGHAEIAAISEAVKQLQRLAEHDPLTGLVNRARFARILETEIVRRSESHAQSALYFVDLDQFKYVNDTLGHAIGDQVLVQVADVLRRRLREIDVVARFGGDEFMLLARDVSATQAAEIANSITHLVRNERIVNGDRVFNTSCSIGVTMMDGARYSVGELLAQADMACYAAKSRGRNTFHFYEPSDKETQRMSSELNQSQLIKEAFRKNGFRMQYQPIVGLGRPKQIYYEVLLRMQNQEQDLVLPSEFLPAADRFGLMVDIDRWVIEHALGALAQFRRDGHNIGFTVNLSGQSFEEPSLLDFIQNHLWRNGLAGKDVIFEITEQSAVRYMDKAQRLIQGLVDIGCRFALDDFGAGFSSFGYLKHLPVDIIKIDGTFVQHMADDVLDQAMVRSIIDVAHTLGKLTVAESVEDARTLKLVRASGADFAQGIYLGKPSEKLLASSQSVVA